VHDVRSHTQKFLFVENPWKSWENWKSGQNPGKNGAPRCLTSKNDAQRLLKNRWRPFFKATPKKGLHDLFVRKFVGKNCTKTFRGNSGENLSHSENFACSYTYSVITRKPARSTFCWCCCSTKVFIRR